MNASSHPRNPNRLRGLNPGRLLDLLDGDVESIKPAIPGWRVTGVAGEGGSGLVWRAEREMDGVLAAIKIASSDEPDTVERIEREARFLRDLRHQNIVRLLDAGPLTEGTNEGGLYLAMEFIDGPSLSQEIPEQGLPPEKAYDWFREIAGAVAHAHDCGVLHRDLKPANVLITVDGHVKVADFGLARPVHRRVHMLSLTRAGQVAGTAEYLPPEAYRRDYQPGPEADIFALGVMLHEMLTGTPPRGAWLPASSRHGVDVRIDDLIRRAMDPDPRQRWPDAKAMLAELDRITGSSPRYAGTPLVTFPIRVADCLWTVLGLLVFLSSLSSLLTLRKAKFSLPLDLVGDHRFLVGGFNALFFLLLPCIPLALWQIIRLRRFRHIPMREALPSPFGLKLGCGRCAAWLVATGQLLCFLLPLLNLLTIYTDTCLSWLEPDDPPWVHGLAVTTWGDQREILDPWKFHPGTRYWLHETEGPPGHPLTNYLDRVGFFPGYVPWIMVTAASLMGLTLLATLLTACRGWWVRDRRLHVIATLVLFGFFGTSIGLGHHGRFVIVDKEHNRQPDNWVSGRMTGQMRSLARQIIGARASAADAAALRDSRYLYAPVVDFHEHGRIARERISPLRAVPMPSRTVRHVHSSESFEWRPECGGFRVFYTCTEFFDAQDEAGAAVLELELLGTVNRHGFTEIHSEKLHVTPLYRSRPEVATRAVAIDWAAELQRACAVADGSKERLCAELSRFFDYPGCRPRPDEPPYSGIFAMLMNERLAMRPAAARVLGPQPGGRTRIAIPLHDPRGSGGKDLTVDLAFIEDRWRGVGLKF
jgi:hypothetical protein